MFLFVPDPTAAVHAMLALARSCEEATTSDAPMWVRTGVHAGTALLTHGDDLIGHDVNLAARIIDLAEAGEVLASTAAVAGVHDPGLRFEPLAPAYVKGISEPVHLFRALSERQDFRRSVR